MTLIGRGPWFAILTFWGGGNFRHPGIFPGFAASEASSSTILLGTPISRSNFGPLMQWLSSLAHECSQASPKGSGQSLYSPNKPITGGGSFYDMTASASQPTR